MNAELGQPSASLGGEVSIEALRHVLALGTVLVSRVSFHNGTAG